MPNVDLWTVARALVVLAVVGVVWGALSAVSTGGDFGRESASVLLQYPNVPSGGETTMTASPAAIVKHFMWRLVLPFDTEGTEPDGWSLIAGVLGSMAVLGALFMGWKILAWVVGT